jgi:mycothiol synthase
VTTAPVTPPPNGLTDRPLSIDDAPAVTDLLAALERAEPTDNSYTETEIREEFTAPPAALDGGGVALLDGNRLVGYGVLHVTARDPQWVAFADGGVHPDVHRRGVGRWLLARQCAQARALSAAQSPDRPAEVRVGVAESRTGTIAALADAGFVPRRYFFRMRADLAGSVADIADPPGVRIRPYRDEDDEAVRLVSNASFADHWGSAPREPGAWRAEFSGAASFRPAASFVAEFTADKGRGIVGFLLAAEHDADTERRGHRTGAVARVGTVRAARGRGIGTALVARSLAAMRELGFAAAELGVDAESPTGAGRLYARLGFEVFARDQLHSRAV